MIQVTRRVTRTPRVPETKTACGVANASEAASAGGGKSLWPITLTQVATAMKRAMKMSKPQPARRPSLPMKILRRVDGGRAAAGSAAFSDASRFNGIPRVARVHLVLTGVSMFCLLCRLRGRKDGQFRTVFKHSPWHSCPGIVLPLGESSPIRTLLISRFMPRLLVNNELTRSTLKLRPTPCHPMQPALAAIGRRAFTILRSEEHTSELQSLRHL